MRHLPLDPTASAAAPRASSPDAPARLELTWNQAFADQVPDAMLLVGVDEPRILEANEAAATLYGLPLATLVTLPASAVRVETVSPPLAPMLERSFEQGALAETLHRRADGTTFLVEVKVHGVLRHGQRAVLAVVRDATRRQRAEAAQRESARRLRLATQIGRLGIWDWDPRTDTVEWNDELLRIYGVAREAFTGKGADYIAQTREDYRAAQLTNIEASVRQGLTLDELDAGAPFEPVLKELCVVRPDGTERYTLGDALTIVDAERKPVRMLGVTLDVTELKRAERDKVAVEAQLRHAQKMEAIGTLAGGIAHDFNNVLTPILAHCDLAQHAVPPESPAGEDLAAIATAAWRARDLVQQILSISRREQGGPPRPVDLALVVKETAKLLRAALPATLALEISLEPGCPPVLGDATQLHQVLLNLCTNARDAIGSGPGRVTVRLGSARSPSGATRVRLAVTDSGAGMTPEVQERIFEPYFTTKPSGQGTGLGLAVVHGIVTRMGGALRVESALGQGSTFTLEWPAVPTPSVIAGRAPTARRGRQQRVLVVDDEPSVRLVLVRTLTALGYQGVAAAGPREALAQLKEAPAPFDALIADLTMPELNGLQLAELAAAAQPGLRVLMCTGQLDAVPRELFGRHGIAGLLKKPFTVVNVGEALATLFAPEGA